MALRFRFAVIAATALIFSAQANPALADKFAEQAKMFVQSIGQRAASLSSPDMPVENRNRAVRTFISRAVDVPAIGRYALGPYWKTASAEERSAYISVFGNFVAQSMMARIGELARLPMTITGVIEPKPLRPGVREIIVMCQIKQKKGAALKMGWRLRQTEEGPKIVDIVVKGISMATVQRDQFVAVIGRNGGKVALLTKMLHAKNTGKDAALANRD